jgi:hypothetical protein
MALNRERWGARSTPFFTRSLFIGSNSSKKNRYRPLGLITVFVFWRGQKIRPLSTLCLAADKYIYYEENNKANKVVNGENIFHNYLRL